MAARTYRGQTYYFCCPGCAEAFEANPEAYIGEEPAHAYKVRERVSVGADPERVRVAEEEARRYGPEIRAAEERSRRARENMERLRRELDQARATLAQDRERMRELEGRRMAPPEEEPRLLDLEREIERERMELQAAERALAEARMKERGALERERTEIANLAERERTLQAELRALRDQVQALETRQVDPATLRAELDRARARLKDYERQMERLGEEKGEIRAEASAALGRAEVMGREAEARRTAGGAMGRLEELEAAERALQADIQTQAARVEDMEARVSAVGSMQRELEQARARLMQRRDELAALGRREDEIEAELRSEDQRLADLQRQVEKERSDLVAAERALTQARARAEEIARRRRAEAAELERRERATKTEIDTTAERAQSLEQRLAQLETEARDAERRANELRDAQRRAEQELDRLRREHRDIVMEDLPAVEGHYPSEFYTAERTGMRRGRGSQTR